MEKILLLRTLYCLKSLNTPMAYKLSLKIHGVHRALEITDVWNVLALAATLCGRSGGQVYFPLPISNVSG